MIIIVSAAIVLLSIIAIVTDPFLWVPLKRQDEEETDETSLPPLSVIIRVGDYAHQLMQNFPLFLEQDYPAGYEYILIINEGDDVAKALIEKYEDKAHIRSSFIPKSSYYISREKLAVTLGVKAAKNEWCLVMDANCYPESNNWLHEMGRGCTRGGNLVIGLSDYSLDSHHYQRFYRLRRFAMLWRESIHGRTYSSNYSNLCLQKSEFIKEDGYRTNLECVRGEYDFIINRFARDNGTIIVTAPESMLREEAPTEKEWHNRRIFYLHSCKLMERGSMHKFLSRFDAIVTSLAVLASIAGIVLGALMQWWIMLGASIVALLLVVVTRPLLASRMAQFINADIPALQIPWLEFTSVVRAFTERIRYWRTDKYDFTCHKL